MSPLAEKAIEIAKSQVGQTEKPLGSNWGHPVQDYLERVGINFPASWCMAFTYWCFDEAAKQLNIPNPLIKTGGVLHARDLTPAQNKFETDPQSGDIFIMDLGKGLGHTGIIVEVDGHSLHTIEGNTNDTGSREGIEVAAKVRYDQRPIVDYLRF